MRLSRLLSAAVLLAACAGGSSAPRQSAPPWGGSGAREQTADQQIHHVLNRLAFGARPGDVEAVRAMGVDAWIDRQLHPERIADPAATPFIAQFETLGKSGTELLANYPPPAQALAQLARRGGPVTAEDSARIREQGRKSNLFVGELASSRVGRAVLTERQLDEVLVDFWENHFSVFSGKDRTRYFLSEYDVNTIRPHAMGKFRDLLGAVAKSPAMLYYLDNWQSVADSGQPVLEPMNARAARRRPAAMRQPQPPRPAVAALAQRRRGLNENYARELMELHTLGVDGGYTQQDVINVARALTGWTLDRGAQGGEFVFRGQVHDAGAKVILGQKFPAGRGEEEGEAVLDLLARHPKTAEFIATKLARRFVSDTPPAALVQRATATFRRTDGDIREVVRTIVTSPEFFAASAYRAKVKSPFELVVSALRALNAQPDGTPRTAQLVSRLGQPIFGHQAPNGYPETGDAWMNTGAILNRINFGLALVSGKVPGVRLATWPATQQLSNVPREQQVDGVIRALLGGDASSDTRQVLLTGTNPFLDKHAATATDSLLTDDDARMTQRTMRAGANANAAGSSAPLKANGFAQIVGLALGAPEFQRR
jgi:uncharacterized protein (DUF1800 family)